MSLLTISPRELEELLPYMTAEERKTLIEVYTKDMGVWRPLPGPQTAACISPADVIGFGGAAGGGKTDLALGLATTEHRVTQFFRRVATELVPVYDRLLEILGPGKYKDVHGNWRIPGPIPRKIEFDSFPNPGDEKKQQGHPKDLCALDEAANMLESQARFVMGWMRSTVVGQRQRILMTFNPPTTSEGRWIVSYFGPWIDPRHARPAGPGELRYFVGTKDNPDTEVDDVRPRVYVGGKLLTEFDHRKFKREDILVPKSRTFIPSRISDNPYLAGTGYMATLQALPEPLRSQMLLGDFTAGMKDSEWQVIPSAWVDAACQRWVEQRAARVRKPPMKSVGVDVARGGDDNSIIARLHEENWFDEPIAYPATQTPDGPTCAGLTLAAVRDGAPVHLEITGVGSSVYDHLNPIVQTIGVNPAETAPGTDKTGLLTFSNVRSWMWWMMREALDPHSNLALALPPDKRLIADLTTPRWALRGKTIYVESREDLLKATRLGRSPDWGSAYVLAWIRTPRKLDLIRGPQVPAGHAHDPYSSAALTPGGLGHNPYA